MKIIVGLGNPGEKYKNTRHNVGFMLLDKYARETNLSWSMDSKLNALIIKTSQFMLIKPQTFMNNSGDTVSKAINYYQAVPDDLVVIHDDVDLELGRTVFRKGMGSAGHHGIEDIMQKIGTKDFWRLRVGVGRPQEDKFEIADYVLQKMDPQILDKVSTTTFIKELNN